MTAVFSDDIKELVRSRTDIVGLIGETVALRSKGREFVGLCPFHDDHNPSMHVYPDRQSYRCWVCNEGGDCFNFVMARERINFREALEMLAQKANVELPKQHRQQGNTDQDNKNRLYEVLSWAENEFHECLQKAPFAETARKYLAERGLTAETIRKFRIGFHPDNWEWLISRAGQGAGGRPRFSLEHLFAVKLIGRNDRGGYYDNFVNRVMFPIRDAQGRPVAFGGRILPGSPADAAKYWNSPESPVFFKSKVLFALGEARDAIVKADSVVVMEGYTDCIMAHQCGVTNVVGTLGTALTETHVTALKRFARKIVLVYDGDAAGQMASERALPKFLAQEVDLRVLTLPENFDPDEFLLERGAEAFNALLATAEEAWQKKLRITVARHGLDSIDARHRVLKDMLDVLAEVPTRGTGLAGDWQLRENVILGGLSQRLGITEERIREQLAEVRERKPAVVTARPTTTTTSTGSVFPARPSVVEQLERELLGHLFTFPAALPTIQHAVSPDQFSHPGLRALLTVCYELAARGIDPVYERVTSTLEDPNLKRLAGLVDEYARRINLSPEHLSPAIASFLDQRERNASRTGGGPHLPYAAGGLEDTVGATADAMDAKTRLRQATERHQKRISRKP